MSALNSLHIVYML